MSEAWFLDAEIELLKKELSMLEANGLVDPQTRHEVTMMVKRDFRDALKKVINKVAFNLYSIEARIVSKSTGS
jgi:hypothetical protein